MADCRQSSGISAPDALAYEGREERLKQRNGCHPTEWSEFVDQMFCPETRHASVSPRTHETSVMIPI